MEAILEDIQRLCGAREVKLVVRPQETDTVFDAPEKTGDSNLTFESDEP
jgi:hypothetical protein